jgi:peptide deformylase
MALKEIRKIGDPVLREKSKIVEKIDDKVIELVNDMIDTSKEKGGVGLAAPQIGVARRVIVVGFGDEVKAFLNPEIKIITKKQEESNEGCLSIYSINDFCVKRFKKIEVRAQDLKGNSITVVAEDLAARIFQHEVDHLNGILYIDHLDRKSKRELLARINEIRLNN